MISALKVNVNVETIMKQTQTQGSRLCAFRLWMINLKASIPMIEQVRHGGEEDSEVVTGC